MFVLGRSIVAASGLAALLALFGAAEAHDRAEANGAVAVAAKGEGVALCGVGAESSVTTATPPDDEDVDTNQVVLTVTFKKNCAGLVIGTFSSEVLTPNPGDFIHVDMFARCLNKGGLENACTPGDRLFASPGHSFFRNTVGAPQTHSFQAIWPELKPGKWRFEVAAGGNNAAQLGYRVLKVEAYTK